MRIRLLTAVVLAALGATFAPIASAQTFSFSDSSNDAPAGAPDLTTTTASIDTNGLLSWTINTSAPGPFGSGTAVSIRIDSDNSPATGNAGADYAVVVLGGYVGLYRWDGSAFVLIPNAPGLTANLGFPESVTLHASAIGSPRQVSFQIFAYGQAPYTQNLADISPNAPSWWTFDTGTPNATGTDTSTSPAPSSPPASTPLTPTTPTTPSTPAPTTPTTPTTPAPAGPTTQTSPTPASLPTTLPTAAPSGPKTPSKTTTRALQATTTSWQLKGKRVSVTVRFAHSVRGAHGTCTFTTGSRKLGTLPATASGNAMTCTGAFRSRAPRRFKVLFTVSLGGDTVRVPVSITP